MLKCIWKGKESVQGKNVCEKKGTKRSNQEEKTNGNNDFTLGKNEMVYFDKQREKKEYL